MSLKRIRRVVISGSLALGVTAVGCGDDNGGGDDTDGGSDSGTADSGAADGGGSDAGTDSGPAPLECGGETCEGFDIAGSPIGACCTDDDKCGFSADDLKEVNPSSGFEGCVLQDSPGVASDAATEYFDRVAADDKAELDAENSCMGEDNDAFDVPSVDLGANLQYSGCCTPEGLYGVDLTTPAAPYNFINTHIGCVSFVDLQSSLATASDNEAPCKDEKDAIDAAMDRNANTIPFCDPATGENACPPTLGPICDGLKAAIAGYECEATDDTPDWVCDRFDAPKDGAQVELGASDCMEGVMAFVNGCGQGVTDQEGCIPSVSEVVFGCAPAPDGNVVPGVPNTVCGCGEGDKDPSDNDPTPCIPNVANTVCGADEP